MRAAARFVREHGDLLPQGQAPTNATQQAVLAVHLHSRFLGPGQDEAIAQRPPPGSTR